MHVQHLVTVAGQADNIVTWFQAELAQAIVDRYEAVETVRFVASGMMQHNSRESTCCLVRNSCRLDVVDLSFAKWANNSAGATVAHLRMSCNCNMAGSEATLAALRVARSFTRRPKVIKFATGYHGHGDPFQTDGKVTEELQDADGVPASVKGAALLLAAWT